MDGQRQEDSTCGKRRFESKSEAARIVKEIKANSSRDRIPNRSYFCVECRGWHLTSKTIKPQKKDKADRRKYKRDHELKRFSI